MFSCFKCSKPLEAPSPPSSVIGDLRSALSASSTSTSCFFHLPLSFFSPSFFSCCIRRHQLPFPTKLYKTAVVTAKRLQASGRRRRSCGKGGSSGDSLTMSAWCRRTPCENGKWNYYTLSVIVVLVHQKIRGIKVPKMCSSHIQPGPPRKSHQDLQTVKCIEQKPLQASIEKHTRLTKLSSSNSCNLQNCHKLQQYHQVNCTNCPSAPCLFEASNCAAEHLMTKEGCKTVSFDVSFSKKVLEEQANKIK